MLAATQYEQNEFDLSCSFRGGGMLRLGRGVSLVQLHRGRDRTCALNSEVANN